MLAGAGGGIKDTISFDIELTKNVVITAGSNHDLRFEGVISGAQGVDIEGAGTVEFAATNTYTGDTTVNGTLDLVGVDQVVNGLEGTGTITNSGALASLTVGSGSATGSAKTSENLITGNISIIKEGSAKQTFKGVSTYTGTTTINAGILELQEGSAVTDTSAVTVNSLGTLEVDNNETVGSLAGAGSVTLNAVLTTGGDNSATEFSGTTTSNKDGGLIKQGTGKFTLSGNNDYKFGVTVNAGILELQNGSALADDNDVTVNASGTLEVDTAETIGSWREREV